MIRLLLGAAALAWASGAMADQAGLQPVVTSQIASTTVTAAGQPIILPSGPVRLIATRYVIAPGASLPVHKHPFPRYAYVLAGNLAVTDTQTGASHTYAAGDMIVEMVDRWHFGQNVGTDPVRLLVLDQVPDGSANTVLRQP